MKTKHSIILLSAMSVSLWLTSCDNKLNIEPATTVRTEQALLTAADLQLTLVGAYDALSSTYLYGGDLQRDGELLGTSPDTGDVIWGGTFTEPQQIYRKILVANNSQVALTWSEAYRAINICNTVLANLNLATSSSRARIEAEAKFIRGSMYFELVRFFARPWGDGDANVNLGVPIVTTPTVQIDGTSNIGRNTVVAVYNQIIQDLGQAETNLPDDGTNGFFATKSAASAQLSRVYLQKADYANAASAANRVIGRQRFGLVTANSVFDLRTFLNGINTPETIFAIQITDQDGTNDLNTFYGSAEVGGRGDIEISESFFSQVETDDARGSEDYFYIDGQGLIRTAKYVNQYGNIQIFRLAEMYLTRAEANFRAGTSVGAAPLADINLIRARAGLGAISQAQLTIGEILRERRIELAFEGTLIHDIKRTRNRVGSLNWNDSRLIYPIPLREMTTNPALVQNQGY
jgi:hypothetical protein